MEWNIYDIFELLGIMAYFMAYSYHHSLPGSHRTVDVPTSIAKSKIGDMMTTTTLALAYKTPQTFQCLDSLSALMHYF